jgi:hypothetical protein
VLPATGLYGIPIEHKNGYFFQKTKATLVCVCVAFRKQNVLKRCQNGAGGLIKPVYGHVLKCKENCQETLPWRKINFAKMLKLRDDEWCVQVVLLKVH